MLKNMVVLIIALILVTPLSSIYGQANNEKKPQPEKKEPWLPKSMAKDDKANPVPSDNTSTEWLFIKSTLVLILIAGSIYLIFRFIQKKKLVNFNLEDGVIKVLNTTSVTPNKSIQLVEIGKYIYIIGISDQNISLISKIEHSNEIDELKSQCQNSYKPENKITQQFGQLLGNYFKGRKQNINTKTSINKNFFEEQISTNYSFDKQRNRLKALNNKM